MSDKRLIRFQAREISPHAVVNWLNEVLDQTSEIYAVVKDKDGNFAEAILLLDPFAGSGAILKAGDKFGMRTIGFEVQEC